MPKTRLKCRSPRSAAVVVKVGELPADSHHTVRQDGAEVIIKYRSALWPLDVAEWAALEGHASDKAAARVMARLRK
ncbi:hypothetical protein ABZ883_41795 [Streptomyces sp. NPDC046977]|uniref:hypothetical protein n=1 Tax=Streptomyces sp. NPDC046977 TaxID=3154703 RepID=UPI0033FA3F87